MTFLNLIFDFLFSVLTIAPLIWALLIGAAIFGVLLVPIYGKISPQKLIGDTKRKIAAALYESVVFRRNTGLSLRAQGRMFVNGLIYFVAAIPPILILAIPCVLVLAQFNLLFGVRGVIPNQPVIISATLAPEVDLRATALEASAGVSISAPVRNPQGHEIVWRVIVPDTAIASLPMTLRTGTERVAFDLAVGEGNSKIYPSNSRSWWKQFLYSTGLHNPGWLSDLEIGYPERSGSWLVIFLCVSILSGYIASKFLGVEV